MNYFPAAIGSEKVTIDGVKVKDKMKLYSNMPKGMQLSITPWRFKQGCVVSYNNEIHILGGSYNSTGHAKWDGNTWTQVSTLPYSFYNGSAVVSDGEIHILGGSANTTKHYKWDGTTWTQLDDYPNSKGIYQSSVVVYNNEIHVLGGWYSSYGLKYHYKWDGTTWTKLEDLPYTYYGYYNGVAIVYDGEIHIIGGNYKEDSTIYSYDHHYKWDGTTWTQLANLPDSISDFSAVVYDGEIYVSRRNTFKWDGTTWTQQSIDPPYTIIRESAIVNDGEIYTFGGDTSESPSTKHCIITPFYIAVPKTVIGIYF